MKPERKTEQLVFRLTERERRDLEKVAVLRGVRLSVILRDSIVGLINKASPEQSETPVKKDFDQG